MITNDLNVIVSYNFHFADGSSALAEGLGLLSDGNTL